MGVKAAKSPLSPPHGKSFGPAERLVRRFVSRHFQAVRTLGGRRGATPSLAGKAMSRGIRRIIRGRLVMCLLFPAVAAAQTPAGPRLDRLKAELARAIDARAKLAQQMVDQVFSYAELGMQEVETSAYLTGILERNGFVVERGVAGIPTSWVARWGSGKPVIALGSDIDCIPQASNKPGVAWHEPMIQGAPGHGEGHNSGQAVNIAAALTVKEIMQREKMPGTLVLWPGVAEEELAGKAFLVRAGVFKDVDVVLFTHVGDDLGVSWGAGGQSALLSAEFRFEGVSAHAAGAPWRGRSALDAVMLMAQ